MCLRHFYYLFVISCILNSCCVKCSNKKKDTRSATTNFGKEEVLKSAHDSCSDLNIIQGGREAHILLYSPWARGVGPRSLIKIETAIYMYIYIYISIYFFVHTHMHINKNKKNKIYKYIW